MILLLNNNLYFCGWSLCLLIVEQRYSIQLELALFYLSHGNIEEAFNTTKLYVSSQIWYTIFFIETILSNYQLINLFLCMHYELWYLWARQWFCWCCTFQEWIIFSFVLSWQSVSCCTIWQRYDYVLIRTYLFLYVYAYIDLLWYSNLISPMSCLITLNSIWVATNWKKTFWVTLVGALAYLGPWHTTSEQQPPTVCGPCQDLKTLQRMATMWWAIAFRCWWFMSMICVWIWWEC